MMGTYRVEWVLGGSRVVSELYMRRAEEYLLTLEGWPT